MFTIEIISRFVHYFGSFINLSHRRVGGAQTAVHKYENICVDFVICANLFIAVPLMFCALLSIWFNSSFAYALQDMCRRVLPNILCILFSFHITNWYGASANVMEQYVRWIGGEERTEKKKEIMFEIIGPIQVVPRATA